MAGQVKHPGLLPYPMYPAPKMPTSGGSAPSSWPRLTPVPGVVELAGQSLGDELMSKHIRDALLYGQSATRKAKVEPTIDQHSDADMVMEMLRRGYAVIKMPADGSTPENLK